IYREKNDEPFERRAKKEFEDLCQLPTFKLFVWVCGGGRKAALVPLLPFPLRLAQCLGRMCGGTESKGTSSIWRRSFLVSGERIGALIKAFAPMVELAYNATK